MLCNPVHNAALCAASEGFMDEHRLDQLLVSPSPWGDKVTLQVKWLMKRERVVIFRLSFPAQHEVLQRGDLRPGARRPRSWKSGWSHLSNQQQPLRQRHGHLHHERSHGAQIHSRGGRGPGESRAPKTPRRNPDVFFFFSRCLSWSEVTVTFLSFISGPQWITWESETLMSKQICVGGVLFQKEETDIVHVKWEYLLVWHESSEEKHYEEFMKVKHPVLICLFYI